MSERVLLVEDDARLAAMVSEYLGEAGFRVAVAASGEEGLVLLKWQPFDLLVLDLTLPGMDGLDVCRRIRSDEGETSGFSVLMLSARGEAADRIVGLELGADDYLPKPFEPRELLARVRALLRRRGDRGGTGIICFGRLEIDRGGREVRLNGVAKPLTSFQFALLAALAAHPGRVLSREVITEMVKGEALEAFDRSIDVHISRIRQAIEDDPKRPRRIITVRGAGYVFAQVQD